MKTIHILADDLTGALDSAAAFGGEISVFIDHPPKIGIPNAQVSVVATPTRDIPPERLPDHLQPVLGWLKSADIAFKKVDSLLRGNTFAEVAWLVRAGEFAATTFAPAFPAQGRITVNGQQWVIEHGSPAGSRTAVAAPLGQALAGLSPCDEANNETKVWAPDVFCDADLDHVVSEVFNRGAKSQLWCGSAGLAWALARYTGLARRPDDTPTPMAAQGNGPSILVSASHHSVLRNQWKVLRQALTPAAFAEHANEVEIASALKQLRTCAGSGWFDLSFPEEISNEEAALRLSKNVQRLVDDLPKPSQLIVVGGDTLLALCRATQADALHTRPSIRDGWGCARMHGGAWDGTPCYSRSGAFGKPDDLLQIVRLLVDNETRLKGNMK
jgi:uncharacterized protein YgbK (DUF1537 family)